MVEQPTRCRHDNIDTAAKRMLLRSHAHAAEHRRRRNRRVDRHVVQAFVNLRGQLTGRREHKRPGRSPRLLHELVQDWKQERVRLPTASHGAGQNVAPLEPRRDGVRLNGGGPGEPKLLETAMQVGMQREAGEGRQGAQSRIQVKR